MRLRNTYILLALFVALAGYVYFFEVRRPPEEPTTKIIYLYQHESSDVESMEVRYQDQTVLVVQDAEGVWHLEKPEKREADQGRVNGAALALGSVVADKVLSERGERLESYGLDRPQLQLDLGLKGGERETLLIGEKNPVANFYYAQRGGDETIYLIDASFAEVVMGLVTRLPIPEPTPTPTASKP